ncbi:MAG: hypothetical protein NZ899_05670 [Thermoguttaceae bacterium]|nr:hypothetical protein [Thermoguttaceae bacterium]MDW8079429.1 hypothetical protein [Thermoguttaceae bacterium]
MPGELDDYLWLISDEGARWLAKLSVDERPLHQLVASLRRELSASRARLVVEQVALRRKAEEKFPWASVMFFTSLGLEQATDAWVGCYKAQRWPAGLPVVDLCCGIGGDLLALSTRGAVTGVDRSPVAAILAQANAQAVLAKLGLSHHVEVQLADVAQIGQAWPEFPPWHIDPDRRPEGHRTAQPEWSSPAPAVLELLLGRQHTAAVKLAPAADVPPSWDAQAEREWVTLAGRCRQQVAWFGQVAKDPGLHAATLVKRTANPLSPVAYRLVGRPNLPVPVAQTVKTYVFDPDPSVLASKLVGEVCHRFALEALSSHGGYLTADHLPPSQLLVPYRVDEILPFDLRKLRAWIRRRNKGEVIIKKRGAPVDVDKWRRLLSGKGDEPLHLILAEHSGHIRAIAVSPLPEPTPEQ